MNNLPNLTNIQIRSAGPADAKALLELYAPYVEKTAITFEYDVPTPEEFENRITRTLKNYPYLVADQNGELLGYAYTGPFVGRAAYKWSAEVSIYIKENKRKMGIGKKLCEALESISKAQNILNLNACIGYTETEDEYLTNNSMAFHAHMGYTLVGRFHNSGYKFRRWYDMIWMEKLIGNHPDNPLPVVPFSQLNDIDYSRHSS